MHDAAVDLTERLGHSLARARGVTMRPKDHHEVDEAAILTRFLFRNEGNAAMISLAVDERGDIVDAPTDIVRRVLEAPEDAIVALDVNRRLPESDPEPEDMITDE
jgi:hypothetical protein